MAVGDAKPVDPAVDKKWIKALSDISKRIEAAASGHIEIYEDFTEEGVDAEATLRHFLEVTCNIRVAPDHSGHEVPTGPGKGHDKTRGVTEVNQPDTRPKARPAR